MGKVFSCGKYKRFPSVSYSHSFHAYNVGQLSSRTASPLFVPCTPAAVVRLLDTAGVSIAGANVVVLGRSDIVGNPVAALMRSLDATVTRMIIKYLTLLQVKQDLSLLSASQIRAGSWVKPGAVVLAKGINYVPGIFLSCHMTCVTYGK